MLSLRAYLHLRRLLAGRLLREIGWLRLAFLGMMLGVAVGRAMVLAAAHPRWQWAVPGLAALSLASAHRQRADVHFLATSAPAYRRWFAVEYCLGALPVAGVLGAFGDWGAAALMLLLASAVAALPPARESRSTRQRARSLFRSEAFEWVSGMRTGGVWVWPLLLGLAVWQRSSPLGPVLALAGWLLVAAACYGTPEPVTMLVLAARTPRQFLGRRLALGLGYGALTAAPLLCSVCIMRPLTCEVAPPPSSYCSVWLAHQFALYELEMSALRSIFLSSSPALPNVPSAMGLAIASALSFFNDA